MKLKFSYTAKKTSTIYLFRDTWNLSLYSSLHLPSPLESSASALKIHTCYPERQWCPSFYDWLETYMQVRKQQLELDMEQQTGSK